MRRTFTLHSSLDSEVDLHASYLENAILVPSHLLIPNPQPLAPSHLSPLPNLALPTFPLVKYK